MTSPSEFLPGLTGISSDTSQFLSDRYQRMDARYLYGTRVVMFQLVNDVPLTPAEHMAAHIMMHNEQAMMLYFKPTENFDSKEDQLAAVLRMSPQYLNLLDPDILNVHLVKP